MQELPFPDQRQCRSGGQRDVLDMMQTEQRNREIVAHALPFDGDRSPWTVWLLNSNDVAAATANVIASGCRSAKARARARMSDVFVTSLAATGDSRPPARTSPSRQLRASRNVRNGPCQWP